MRLTLESIVKDAEDWKRAGVKLPGFDIKAVREETARAPEWVHFGPGNIFRGFLGSVAQHLIEKGLLKTGIVAIGTRNPAVIENIYKANDCLTLNVLMNPDGTTSREILAGIADGVQIGLGNPDFAEGTARIVSAFRSPSLKLVTFTVTEKAYKITNPDGSLQDQAAADMENGPSVAKHSMGVVAALLLERFKAGRLPIAVVSMDNCSHNGDKLKASVVAIAKAWVAKGFAGQDFVDYLEDRSVCSFPWTMIDKITPRPHQKVYESLKADGIEGMEPEGTAAGFVNAEKPQTLVIEDSFPNGRPPFEKLDGEGVYLGTAETVDMTEKMKVTTCLNPLHTSMSMYGCLFGYTLICDEMKDADIVKLVKRLGYVEGLPVVVDPKIISPKAFLDEVVEKRLPNPFMPDDPRRIATDTSAKVGPRFGETIKSYVREKKDFSNLVSLPLAIAGWLRYLLAVNDRGEPMQVSDDPLREELQAKLADVVWNDPKSYKGQIRPILANESIFGSDLTKTPLADRIEGYFVRLLGGPGSARALLQSELR